MAKSDKRASSAPPDGESGLIDQARVVAEAVIKDVQKRLPPDLVKQVELMAREKGCQPSQLALAWVLAQGDDVVPIPGTKRRKYLEENVGALEIELTIDDLRALNEVFPSGAAAGERYPEHMMALVNA